MAPGKPELLVILVTKCPKTRGFFGGGEGCCFLFLFYLTVSVSQETRPIELDFCFTTFHKAAIKVSAMAGVSSEGLTTGGSTSKLPYMVIGRIQFLGNTGIKASVTC